MKRSLVLLERMPVGWLATPEGKEWFARRTAAFSVMAAAHEKHMRENPKR